MRLSVFAASMAVGASAIQTNMTIYDYMANSTDLTTLANVLNTSGYEDVMQLLSQPGNHTLFAPNNDAVATADPNVADVAAFKATLQYHLLTSKVTAADLQPLQFVATASNSSVYVNLGGSGQVLDITKGAAGVEINGVSKVVTADLECTNGVIHVVDTVLALANTTAVVATNAKNFTSLLTALTTADLVTTVDTMPAITILAPTDDAFAEIPSWVNLTKDELVSILTFHVSSEAVLYSTDITNNMTVTTLNNKGNLTFFVDGTTRAVTVHGGGVVATVVIPNVLTQNGVVHAIDKVLIPETPTPPTQPPTNATMAPTGSPTFDPMPKKSTSTLQDAVSGAVGAALDGVGAVGAGTGVVQLYKADNKTWTVANATLPSATLGFAVASVAGTTFVFAGGTNTGMNETSDVATLVDAAGMPQGATNLGQGRAYLAGVTAGTAAIFAGGLHFVPPTNVTAGSFETSDFVDVWYDLTGSDVSNKLSQARGGPAAAATDKFALFAGGHDANFTHFSAVVDVFDVENKEFIAQGALNLTVARAFLAGAALASPEGHTFMFAGGMDADMKESDVVDVFFYNTTDMTWSQSTRKLKVARAYLSGAATGKYAAFAGGMVAGTASDAVDLLGPGNNDISSQTLASARKAPAFFTVSAACEQGVCQQAVFAGGSDSKNVDMFSTPPVPTPPPTPVAPTPAAPTPAPDADGLGAGDIVLIILGSLLVLGGIAFCVRSKKTTRALDEGLLASDKA